MFRFLTWVRNSDNGKELQSFTQHLHVVHTAQTNEASYTETCQCDCYIWCGRFR